MTTLLTIEQAAERLGISQSLTRRYCREGKLQGFKLGSRWVVTQQAVETFTPRRRGRPSKERTE